MTATSQPDRSSAPGIIPEPVEVYDEPAAPTAATEQRDDAKPGRRNPVRLAAAKVMSALRGDKYMIDAYPAPGHEDAATRHDAKPRPEER
jgi:hypothetical protein